MQPTYSYTSCVELSIIMMEFPILCFAVIANILKHCRTLHIILIDHTFIIEAARKQTFRKQSSCQVSVC